MSHEDTRREKDMRKAQTWFRYLKGGVKARKSYMDMAKITLGFLKSEHSEFYESIKSKVFDFTRGGLAVSVSKAAELRSVLGANLYQQNPTRTINTKSQDTVMQGLGSVLAAYGNYTQRESGLEEQIRKAIDDALLRGRGFLRTGYDPELACVTSWAFSSARVLIDPAADSFEEAHWIALRSRAPVWVVKRRFGLDDKGQPAKWRTKGLKANICSLRQIEEDEEDAPDAKDQLGETVTKDLVEYWEIYSKMGAGLSRGPEAREEDKSESDANDFVKLVIAKDHEIPLYEGAWECPLYLDKQWPLVKLDLVDCVDELWPQSIFGQALGYARTINFTSSLRLAGCAAEARKILLRHPDAFESTESWRMSRGGPFEVIDLKALPVGLRMEDTYHVVQIPPMSPEIAEERAWAERGFENQTGVTAILTGGAETGAQDRSATASSLRSQASQARLGDMQAKVESFCTRVARNEGILVRLGDYVPPESIGKTAGEVDLGWLVSVQGPGYEMPVRAPATQPGAEPPLTVQALEPAAGEYFTDATGPGAGEALATESALLVQEAMLMAYQSGDPRVIPYAQVVDGGEVVFDVRPRRVTVFDVFRDTSGMTPQDVVREFMFEIEAGTTQRLNSERKLQIAENLLLNVVPLAHSAGDMNWVNAALKMVYKAWGLPPNERPPDMQLAMPAAPMAPGEEGQEGEEPSEEAVA